MILLIKFNSEPHVSNIFALFLKKSGKFFLKKTFLFFSSINIINIINMSLNERKSSRKRTNREEIDNVSSGGGNNLRTQLRLPRVSGNSEGAY